MYNGGGMQLRYQSFIIRDQRSRHSDVESTYYTGIFFSSVLLHAGMI